jgi:uncharacterized membrane protein
MTMGKVVIRGLVGLRRDQRGVVAPAVAVLAISLLAAAGLALDVGLYYMGNRELRSATEAAALSAATAVGNPQLAQARATEYLVHNGYAASVVSSVQFGRYCADDSLTSGNRFVASNTPCAGEVREGGAYPDTAVRLVTTKPSRRFLTGILGGANPIPALSATATAARIDEAGIGVTSDILRLTQGGITATLVNTVNGLLGALLNLKLSLSAPDILALMSHNVDAGEFFDKLASNTGQTGTYAQLVAGTYGMQDIASAAADAAHDAGTAAALRRFGTSAGNGYKVPLAGLFGLGVWRNMPVGESQVTPSLRAGLNAYQLIAFAAQAGPGAIDASDLVSLAVPGSTVRIAAVANGPLAQPRFAFGPAGEAKVASSQLRLQLMVGLQNINLSLLGSLVSLNVNSLPVLIDIGPSAARVTQISCANTDNQDRDTVVRVRADSGLVRAYIAEIPPAAMTKQMPAIGTLNPVSLINTDVSLLGIKALSVNATAKVAVGSVTGAARDLTFGPGGNGTIGGPQVVGTPAGIYNQSQVAGTLGSVITGLSSGLDVKVTLLSGLLGLSTSAITSLIFGDLLQGITTQLLNLVGTTADPLLDSVLAALGIQLGNTTVWATGARCGVPVLI